MAVSVRAGLVAYYLDGNDVPNEHHRYVVNNTSDQVMPSNRHEYTVLRLTTLFLQAGDASSELGGLATPPIDLPAQHTFLASAIISE